MDVGQQKDSRYPIMDGWHEAWSNPKHCKQIARSFEEFLERVLRSGGKFFWLKRKGA